MPDLPKQQKPKVDAIQRTYRIFTVEQFAIFLDECEERMLHGFGEVAIVFDNHHPLKVKQYKERYLPKPGAYKAE